jgi:hypothetical protein
MWLSFCWSECKVYGIHLFGLGSLPEGVFRGLLAALGCAGCLLALPDEHNIGVERCTAQAEITSLADDWRTALRTANFDGLRHVHLD